MNSCDPNLADAAKRAGSVLLVDDEKALLEIYEAILEPHFDVMTATNAQAAEVLLRANTFKVIVADHRMPGETGLSLLARVRLEFPHLQRVLVTGNMTSEMHRSAAESDLLFSFLVKPVSIAQLIEVVQSAVQMHDANLVAAK